MSINTYIYFAGLHSELKMLLVRKRMALVVCSLVRNDLYITCLLSIMQKLLLLMGTTLKLLQCFGTISQSKPLLQSVTATVTQVNNGLFGTYQACSRQASASKSPLTVHMNGDVFLIEYIALNIYIGDYILTVLSAIHDAF